MNGEIQYVADTILLEETFQVLAEFNPSNMEKYAFDLASVLPSIGSEVSSLIGSNYSTPRKIVDLLVPGLFFGIHPALGALVSVAQHFGYDIFSIFNKIKDAILPDIAAGKPVSAEQVNSAAQSAIPQVVDEPQEPPQEQGEVDDLLYPLRAMRNSGQLTKEAIGGSYYAKNRAGGGGWLNPLKGLLNLFSGRRRGNIIVGLLSWFLKTVLLSAGLLTIAGMVLPSKNPITGEPASSTNNSLVGRVSKPTPTGAGAHVYKTKPGDLWIESLTGRQPHEMVLDWAIQSYPTLSQYESIILNTPSFWNAVRSVTEKWRPGQVDISIPDPYKTRDEIVNLFINDVFKAVSNEGRQQ
jgi:hypothetical protein